MPEKHRINNLDVIYSQRYGKWQVRTLKGVVLEEFTLFVNAKKWAEKPHDFIQR